MQAQSLFLPVMGFLTQAFSQILNQMNAGQGEQDPAFVEIDEINKDFTDEELKNPKNFYRDREVFFIKLESGLNILGFLSDISGTSGRLRMAIGTMQILLFGGSGIFHLIMARFKEEGEEKDYYNRFAKYEYKLMEHGFANLVRGAVENVVPVGNWILLLHALSGDRQRYENEGDLFSRGSLIYSVVPILGKKKRRVVAQAQAVEPPPPVAQMPIAEPEAEVMVQEMILDDDGLDPDLR